MATHYIKLGLVFAAAVRVPITGREAHLHMYAVHQIISWEVLLAVVTVKTVVVVLICMPCIVVDNEKKSYQIRDTQFLHWSLGTQMFHQLCASI